MITSGFIFFVVSSPLLTVKPWKGISLAKNKNKCFEKCFQNKANCQKIFQNNSETQQIFLKLNQETALDTTCKEICPNLPPAHIFNQREGVERLCEMHKLPGHLDRSAPCLRRVVCPSVCPCVPGGSRVPFNRKSYEGEIDDGRSMKESS